LIRLLLGVVLLFVTLTGTVNAGFQSQDDVSKWLTYYYLKPDPTSIPDAIEYMSRTSLLDEKNLIAPIFGFLAGGFKDNPDQTAAWVDRLGVIKESHLRVVVLGLWYANLPDSKNRVYAILDKHPSLKKEFGYLYQGSPMPVEEIPLEQGPWVLDALWGNFMATGSKTPVLRIAMALPWIDVKGDINRLLVGGAARWSLTSNAVQHQRVMQICEAEVGKQPKKIAKKLREVIDDAKEDIKSGQK
jgi:hypothetical protein